MSRRTTPKLALLALAVGCESDSLSRQPLEPALSTTGAATVLAAGDIAGCQSSYKDDSTAQVIAQYPEATVLVAGDMAYDDGTAANFACYNASWGAFKARTRPAIGNHEMHVIPGIQDTAGQGYYDYWGAQAGERYKGYYAFDLGGWRIYALNSEISHGSTSEQYAWLRGDLNAHAGGCQLAYWHRPSFTSGVNHSGASDFRPIWDLLTEFRAEAVISGHNHNYEVFAPQRSDGTPDPNAPRQFVVGTGGSPSTYLFTEPPQPNSLVRATGVFGLLKMDLTPEGASWEFVSAPGTNFTDTGSLACDAPGTPPTPNTPPKAFFGSACSRSSCKFTDRSTDTDGNATIVRWSWAFGDGTSFATSTFESRHPSHTYRAVGTYKPTLTVTDRAGATGTILHSITLSSLNLDPTALFTPSCSGLACTFDDTSTDPDGTISTRKWDYGDGTIGTTPSHAYSAAGTFPITLTVTDNDGGTGAASRTVTVHPANAPPTAGFEASCVDLACSFTDLSGDTDGTIAGWRWDFGDGVVLTETASSNPSHDYATAGRYTVELTVTDEDGATHAASQLVTAGNPDPNAAPAAEFTWDCPAEGLTCTFDAEGSSDDIRVAEWSWDFGDGGTATSETPAHTFAGGGTYSVSLTVKDNEGISSTPVTHDVTVNQAPSAGFSATCTNLTCTFTDQSTDAGGSIVSRSWSFGDGTTSTETNPVKTYTAAGTYTVQLTVTDNSTASATASKTVTVTAPVLNAAPKAFFGSSCTRLVCKFTDRSTDADGNSTIVRWSWTYGDGKSFTTTNPAARSPSYAYAAGGTYKPRLTVTDNKGATGSIVHVITVTP